MCSMAFVWKHRGARRHSCACTFDCGTGPCLWTNKIGTDGLGRTERAHGDGDTAGGTGGSTTVGALHLSRKVTTICKSLSDLLFAAPPKYVKFRSRKKKGLRAPDVKF